MPFDDGKDIPSELIVDTSSIPTETTELSRLPITEEIPEVTVEGLRRGHEVIAGNEANSIGDIREEANERRSKGEKFFIKETVKDGKDIFTLVDTTVYDEFARPAYKAASVEVPKNSRLSAEALMRKLKNELGVTDKTNLQYLDKMTSEMKAEQGKAAEVKVTEEAPEAKSTVEGNDFLNDLKNLSKSLGEPKGKKIQINTTEDIKSQKAKPIEVKDEAKPTTQEIKEINEVHKNLFNQYSKKQSELIKEGLRGSDLENNPELVGIKNQMNKIEDYFKDTQVPQPAKKIEPTKVKEEVKIEEPVSTQKVKIPGTKQSKPIPLSDFTLGKEGERSFTKRVKKDEGGVSGVEPLNQFKLNQGMDSYGNPYPRVHIILDNADAEKYQAYFSAGGKRVPKNFEFRDEINKIAKANRSKTDEVVLDFRKSEIDALTKKAAEVLEAPKPVKEAPKEEKEAQAYKDLTRNEKRQIINSKFDELIKELKIEKICPT